MVSGLSAGGWLSLALCDDVSMRLTAAAGTAEDCQGVSVCVFSQPVLVRTVNSQGVTAFPTG